MEKFEWPNFDDKDLGIICITLIAIFTSFKLEDASTIIIQSITGIAALVIGRKNGNG